MIGETFEDVLVAAQRGDHAAIEAIYRDVAPLVLGYLRSNGARDAEDVASEVFVSLVTGLGTFAGDERQFRSWLLTIAHRRLVDDHRRRGRRPEDPVVFDSLPRPDLAVDGEAVVLARLRARGVLEVIEGLTEDQRAALMLRVLADLPVKEVAAVMGKPESAVKALLRRATASLARTLDAGAEGESGPAG